MRIIVINMEIMLAKNGTTINTALNNGAVEKCKLLAQGWPSFSHFMTISTVHASICIVHHLLLGFYFEKRIIISGINLCLA